MQITIESLISDADIPLHLNTQSTTIVRNISATGTVIPDINAMFTKTRTEFHFYREWEMNHFTVRKKYFYKILGGYIKKRQLCLLFEAVQVKKKFCFEPTNYDIF